MSQHMNISSSEILLWLEPMHSLLKMDMSLTTNKKTMNFILFCMTDSANEVQQTGLCQIDLDVSSYKKSVKYF